MGLIKYNNLGKYGDVSAVWDKHPEGGREGDYVTIGTTTYYWDNLARNWAMSGGGGGGGSNPASQTVDGNLNVGGNLNVAGDANVTGDVTIDGTLNVSRINFTGDPLPEPKDGQSVFKSIVFKRSTSRPSNIPSTQGTFYNPVPAGWSDGVPTGNDPIWMSCRIFTNDGEPPQGGWSRPELMVDSYNIDVEFSDSIEKPATPSAENRHNGSGEQVWYDPYLDAAYISQHEMIWMATSTRISTSTGPVWGPWTIVRVKGEIGKDGMGYEHAYCVHPKAYPPIITNAYADLPVTVGYMWSKTTDGVIVPTNGSYALWMSVRSYNNNVYGPWTDAVRISGDGAPGVDGADIEFIFKQMDRLPTSEDTAPTNNVSQDNFVPDEWYDEAKGVDALHKCEWMCQRTKRRGSNVWSDWVGPIAWSVYGDTGMDGASVQFVFTRTTAEEGKPSRPEATDGGYINDQGEYIPRGWSDEPQGTNSYYTKEWVSMRRKGEKQNDWGAFSEPAVWSVYSEQHTVEIKGGTWWIDGRDTGVKAEGEDGSGIVLTGVVDYLTTAEITTTGETSLEGVTGMEVGDCYVVKNGAISDKDGYLYVYNGGSTFPGNWTELGAFRGNEGPAGTSSYVHIAWAYNIDFDQVTGEPLDSNTIYTDYSALDIETNGYPEWQGIAVTSSDPEADNYNATGQDPTSPRAYKWNHLRGKDGSDYERVYIRTRQFATKPQVDATVSQTDQYLPACVNATECKAEQTFIGQSITYRFTADPKGPDKNFPYEWVAERKKVDGVWGPFGVKINNNYYASMWAVWSKPPQITIDGNGYWRIDGELVDDGNGGYVKARGENGEGLQIKGSFPSVADLEEAITDPAVGDCYYITSGNDMGHLFVWDGEGWQDIGEIKGEAGQSQYMHVAWATDVKFLGNTVTRVIGFSQSNAVNGNYKWVGFRATDSATLPNITSAENDPEKLAFKWNFIAGMDGDQYEYVYIQTTTEDNPGVQNEYSSSHKDSNNHAPTADEFLPETTEDPAREYTDDPHGVDDTNQFEWECYRRKNAGSWGAWQGPYLVHNWAKDGAGQAYVRVDMDQVVIDCTDAGVPKTAAQIEINAYLYWGDEACTLETVLSSIAVQCTGFGGNINNCASQTSIDSTKGYVKLIIKTKNPIASGTITFSLVGEDSDGGTHTATKVVPIIANMQGAKGAKGDTGAVLRFKGEFDPNDTTAAHVWNENYRDCVKCGNGYYMVGTYGATLGYQDVPGVSSDWTYMGASVKFFATELLLAEKGAINLLSSNVINLFNANSQLVAKINGNGEGSYCIYYPGTTKKWYEMIPGWQIYYDNDADNTELWRLGKTGVIMRPTLGVWTDIDLAALTQQTIDTFDGTTTFVTNPYRQYIADSGDYNGKIFTVEPVNHNPESTSNVLPDGQYTPNAAPRQTAFINKGDDHDAFTITVFTISGGYIVGVRDVEHITATSQN